MEKIFKHCRHTLIALGLLLGIPTIALAQAAPSPANPSYSTSSKFTYARVTAGLWLDAGLSLGAGAYNSSTFYGLLNVPSTLAQNTTYTIPDPAASSAYVVLGAGTSTTGGIVYHSQVALTVANVTGMNGTPVSVITAVTGKTIVVTDCFMTYTEAGGAYASGGTVQLQYHGGSACTGTVAATAITAASGSTYSVLKPVSVIGLQATGIDITNNTGAFTQSAATGAPVLDLYYRLQ